MRRAPECGGVGLETMQASGEHVHDEVCPLPAPIRSFTEWSDSWPPLSGVESTIFAAILLGGGGKSAAIDRVAERYLPHWVPAGQARMRARTRARRMLREWLSTERRLRRR